MEKATSKIRNFLWSGTAIQTKARVAWRTCCMQREDGGLNMIKPQEALLARPLQLPESNSLQANAFPAVVKGSLVSID
jgi:hypothetical protein